MDPVAAIGLVCNIVQILGLSIKAVKKCREIYKDGALSENRELEEMARHLTDLRTNLDTEKQGDVDELMDLGSQCSMTAKDLVAELEKLKVTAPQRKRQVVSKTLKTMWKKDAIEDIQKRLDKHRRVLDTKILVDLRERYHFLALQQSEGFQELDLKFQTLITQLAQGPQNFDVLRSLVQDENMSVKRYITDGFQFLRRDLAYVQYCQQFLNSLHYPEIHRRQESVGRAHQKTFQWIFELDASDRSRHQWDSFVHWLEQGRGIYWIGGKAGSGKSTLMSYLCQEKKTLKSLSVWSGTKELFTPSFFFWNAGSALEKTSEGLLRSLLHQILQRFPSLTPLPSVQQSAAEPASNGQYNFRPIAAWTERRLHATFQGVLRSAQEVCNICIFIDGLDETSGDPYALIAMIKDVQSAGVKVCLSSRPDRPYTDAFDSFTKLKLQDLTAPDIKTYVWDRLQPYLRTESEMNVSEVIESIVHKAQGVFLWVELVVKSLINGFRIDDSLEQLQTRVNSLPSDVEYLHANMLSNIEFAHREEAAQLFRMARVSLTSSLLNVALALHKTSDVIPEISIQKALELGRRIQQRLPTICAGLLEVHQDSSKGGFRALEEKHHLTLPPGYTCSLEAAKLCFLERYAYINFIHRTAVDFLCHSKQAQQFLMENSQSSASPRSAYVRALLSKATLLGFLAQPKIYLDGRNMDPSDRNAQNFVYEVMLNVFLEEWQTGTAQVSLCDDVERTLAMIDKRHRVILPHSHWSTRWGVVPPQRRFQYPRLIQWSQISPRSSSQVILSSDKSDSMQFSDEPIDFLGFAAAWGLISYVLETFDAQNKQTDTQYTNYMLCCCTRALSEGRHFALSNEWDFDLYDEWVSRVSQLVIGLLERGGNPNVYVEKFSTTIWGMFLTQHMFRTSTWRPVLTKITKAFIESGADIHLKAPSQIDIPCLEHQVDFDPSNKTDIYFRIEKTVLYIIRGWLKDGPELKALEDMVLARGSIDSRRYVTHVVLKTDNYRPHTVSESQNERLMAVLDAADYNPYRFGAFPARQNPGLVEKCREILEWSRDIASCVPSDKDATSDTEAEDEFHEAVSNLTEGDLQDCQPIG